MQKISLDVEWIPRDYNQLADYLSKVIEPDDWAINQEVFDYLSNKYGPFEIDRMANEHNKKLYRYNSRFFDPKAEAVDCFTENWQNIFNYACPPPSLILSVLKHMMYCKAYGCLIIPRWESGLFWPFLIDKPGKFKSFVKN